MSDTFTQFFKIGDSDSGLIVPPSSGQGSSDSDLDDRYLQIANDLSEVTPATARSNLGLVIGTDVQAWDTDLDTYAANPLTAAELGQLQNIGATTISATQWGYLGSLDQDLHTAANVQFNNLEVTGTINFVSQNNLQVEDKTITVNKGGTNTTAENAGLIIERPAGNQSVLWNSTDGFDFSDGAAFAGDIITRDNVILGIFEDATFAQGLKIQSNITDQITQIQLVPSGTEDQVIFDFVNADDVANFGSLRFILDGAGFSISPRTVGTGTAVNSITIDPATTFNSNVNVVGTGTTVLDDGLRLQINRNGPAYINNSGGASNELRIGVGSTTADNIRILSTGNIEFNNSITQTTGTIGTDNFVSQLTGWRGTYAGAWDVRTIFADQAIFKAFTADIEQALAGSDFLTKSVAILDTDFTIPWGQPIVAVDTTGEVIEVSGDHTANVNVSDTLYVRQSTGNDGTYTVASVTFNGTSGNTEITVNEDVTDATADGYIGKQGTLSVEDLPGQDDIAAFTASDWIRLRIFDRSGGGLTIGDAWGLVTGYTDQADGTQDWTFTTLDSGFVTGLDIFKGSIVLDYGVSGDGYIERTVLDAQGSPYSQVVTWTGNPIDNQTLKTRLGILDGVANASGAGLYGENTFLTGSLLAGDLTKAGNYLEYASGVLTVKGQVVVQGGSGISSFTDAGALAVEDAVDLATTQVLNKSADNITESLSRKWAAESGAQINAAGSIALEINVDISGTFNPGEGIIVGTSNGIPDRSVDGYINWNGSKITIPRAQSGSFTILTGAAGTNLGFIAFDTTQSDPFIIGVPSSVAFVRKNGSQWQYDNNSSWINFTPSSDYVSLGWLKNTGDNIDDGGLFGQPVTLTLASFPRADVTSENTAAAITGQGDLATLNLVEEAQLGTTVISGGLIVSDLLSADRVITGTLQSQLNNITFNLDTGAFNADVFDLNATTLVLENTTPKLALGAAADSLGLSSVSDTGTYLNGSGHVRIGTTDAAGALTKGFKFDGTNVLLEAGNASIGVSSGFFGASDILSYSLNSVTLAAFTANNEYLTNGQTFIGENLSQFATAASGNLLLGDFGTAGTDPRIFLAGTVGSAAFAATTNSVSANTSSGPQVFKIDLTGTESHFVGGAFFDANDLWLSPDGTKANATVLLDGVNSAVVTDSIGELVISPSSTAATTTNAAAEDITDDEFHERVTRSTSGGPSTSRNVKKGATFKKRFGVDKIIVTGIARQAGSAGEGGGEIIIRNARIYAKVTDQVTSTTAEDFTEITSTSPQQFSFELDISTMTDDNLVLLEISVYVDISITSSSGDTEDTECWLREDLIARTAT